MVNRLFASTLFILLLGAPAAAQFENDFPRVEVGFGYANYGLPGVGGSTDRLNGFSMHSAINLDSWIGFENYTGAYSVPNDITLITNIFGAKLVARDLVEGRISPYLVAGLGVGYFTSNQGRGGFSELAYRLGGGIDFNLTGGMAFKVDVSNMAIKDIDVGGGWGTNINISTGLVFYLGN